MALNCDSLHVFKRIKPCFHQLAGRPYESCGRSYVLVGDFFTFQILNGFDVRVLFHDNHCFIEINQFISRLTGFIFYAKALCLENYVSRTFFFSKNISSWRQEAYVYFFGSHRFDNGVIVS
ncbi:hypothetical protein D3C74_352370 [compost metagenome]